VEITIKQVHLKPGMTRTHEETRLRTWTVLWRHRTCTGQCLCPL